MAEALTAKERQRFRKLLEVAHSSTFTGERDAALAAATRLADSRGLTLREAAGMSERAEPPEQPKPHKPAGFSGDFGARVYGMGADAMGNWRTARQHSGGYRTEAERVAAEKKRYAEAMAEAIARGLDAEERAAKAKAEQARPFTRTPGRGSWRSRPEFIRVLLRETSMNARDIAHAAGVTIYDVFKEKLLMRRRAAG
jgi:hypothetical protein